MIIKKAVICAAVVLTTGMAEASSDYFCDPNWALIQRSYTACSNLPFLSPGNDRRVNLGLLLADAGHAELVSKPVSSESAEHGYGRVPFEVADFVNGIFMPNDAASSKTKEAEQEASSLRSRCISNGSGASSFLDAVKNSKKLTEAERKALTEVRQGLKPDCVDILPNKPGTSDKPKVLAIKVTSPAGTEFRQYLIATVAFYEGRYEEANDLFQQLAKSEPGWVCETSRYMLGRNRLNLAQKNAFDEYGFPELKKVEIKALAKAEEGLNSYLHDYPSGQYAQSARGLLRRVYWMLNSPRKLAAEFDWQLKHPASPQHNLSLSALIVEADNKLFDMAASEPIDIPMFLAVQDLAGMRSENSSTFSGMDKQLASFKSNKPLYEYLLAVQRFYLKKDPAGALKILKGDIPPRMTWLDFSRLMLRGLALEGTDDYCGARQHWLKMLKVANRPLQAEAVQLALAINYEQSGEVGLAFSENSPVKEPAIRSILIEKSASQELLRSIIRNKKGNDQERGLALYTLLYKDLLQGRYSDYIQDYPLLSKLLSERASKTAGGSKVPGLGLFDWSGEKGKDSYDCPATVEIAKILAKNPQDPLGLVCLGDFVKTNDISANQITANPDGDKGPVLGSITSEFPGNFFSRGEAYKLVMNNPHASHDLKAYALYRAVRCYAKSGYNGCGGNDVEISSRKAWFKTLKKDFADTSWAKSSKYYW